MKKGRNVGLDVTFRSPTLTITGNVKKITNNKFNDL